MTYTKLPDQGIVFWPVGTGDSTTVVVHAQYVLQVDLHDQDAADEDGAVVAPVIDRLSEVLPTNADGDPYLAVFALTHADLDHCRGFGDLLDSDIVIGELWATPRLWRELGDDVELCEDAQRFHDEVVRRVEATLSAVAAGREPASGDRVRVIGYDFDQEGHGYCDLPNNYRTFPGQEITTMDGVDVSRYLSVFVHAPFKDDCAGERNETSLAMHIMLRHPDHEDTGGVLLFGDLAYETIKKIFTYSMAKRPERLAWDAMLAAHHGSRKVMYAPGDDGKEELKQDILDNFAEMAGQNGYIIISSRPFRDVDPKSANPPHLLARHAYNSVAPTEVICTGEYPDADDPRPVVLGLVEGVGLQLLDIEDAAEFASASGNGARILKQLALTAVVAGGALAASRVSRVGLRGARDAVTAARGGEPESLPAVGFGCS
jgi:hypothetical protein